MVAAAGEYYDKTSIEVADVTNPAFQKWLKELMGAVTDFSIGGYSVENLALFGYSTGDGGQLMESDLLVNMAGIQTRWADPLVIVYPKYLTWFDFPFTVWMGEETTAEEKNAALVFEQYLLTTDLQKLAAQRGLRPANLEVDIAGADSLFTRWQSQGATTVVPRSTRMRSPDREVLQALLRWFRSERGQTIGSGKMSARSKQTARTASNATWTCLGLIVVMAILGICVAAYIAYRAINPTGEATPAPGASSRDVTLEVGLIRRKRTPSSRSWCANSSRPTPRRRRAKRSPSTPRALEAEAMIEAAKTDKLDVISPDSSIWLTAARHCPGKKRPKPTPR